MARAMPLIATSLGSAATIRFLAGKAVVFMTFFANSVVASLWAFRVLSAAPICRSNKPPRMGSTSFIGAARQVGPGNLLVSPFVLASVASRPPAFAKCGYRLILYVAVLAWCVSRLVGSMSLWLLATLLASPKISRTRPVLALFGTCCLKSCQSCLRVARLFFCLTPMASLACVRMFLAALWGELMPMLACASQTVKISMARYWPVCCGCTVSVQSTRLSMLAILSFTILVPSAAALTTSAVLLRCARQPLSARCGIVQVMRFSSSTQTRQKTIGHLLLACRWVCITMVGLLPNVCCGTMMPSNAVSYMVTGGKSSSQRLSPSCRLWMHGTLLVITILMCCMKPSIVKCVTLQCGSFHVMPPNCKSPRTHCKHCRNAYMLAAICGHFTCTVLRVMLSRGCLLLSRGWMVDPCKRSHVLVMSSWVPSWAMPSWPGCSLLAGWQIKLSSACAVVTATVLGAFGSTSCILLGKRGILQRVGSCPDSCQVRSLVLRNVCSPRLLLFAALLSGLPACSALVRKAAVRLFPGIGRTSCSCVVLHCNDSVVRLILLVQMRMWLLLVVSSGTVSCVSHRLIGLFLPVFGACCFILACLGRARRRVLARPRLQWWPLAPSVAYIGSLPPSVRGVARRLCGMPLRLSPLVSTMASQAAKASVCCMAWILSAKTSSCMFGERPASMSPGLMLAATQEDVAGNMQSCSSLCFATAWIWLVVVAVLIFLMLRTLLRHPHILRCCSLSKGRRRASGFRRYSVSVWLMLPCSCRVLMASWFLALVQALSLVTQLRASGFWGVPPSCGRVCCAALRPSLASSLPLACQRSH